MRTVSHTSGKFKYFSDEPVILHTPIDDNFVSVHASTSSGSRSYLYSVSIANFFDASRISMPTSLSSSVISKLCHLFLRQLQQVLNRRAEYRQHQLQNHT